MSWEAVAQSLKGYTLNGTLSYLHQNPVWLLAQGLPIFWISIDWNHAQLPLCAGDICLKTDAGRFVVVVNLSDGLPISPTSAYNDAQHDITYYGSRRRSVNSRLCDMCPFDSLINRRTCYLRDGGRLRLGRRFTSPSVEYQMSWYTLAYHARTIAKEHRVAPHDLILSKQAGIDLTLSIL